MPRLLCCRFCQAPCVWALRHDRPLRLGFSDTTSATIGKNPFPTSGPSFTVQLLAARQALGKICPEQPSIRADPVWPDTPYCVRPEAGKNSPGKRLHLTAPRMNCQRTDRWQAGRWSAPSAGCDPFARNRSDPGDGQQRSLPSRLLSNRRHRRR